MAVANLKSVLAVKPTRQVGRRGHVRCASTRDRSAAVERNCRARAHPDIAAMGMNWMDPGRAGEVYDTALTTSVSSVRQTLSERSTVTGAA